MPKLIDLSGTRFNYLTVLSRGKNIKNKTAWLCICDCGNKTTVRADQLKNNHTVSCGHIGKINLEKRIKHGRLNTAAYSVWRSMKARCLGANQKSYKYYGGRGIKISDEWMNFEGFYKDMGDPPRGHSLDRINNNEGYCKKNCRWASTKTQARNKRTNIKIQWQGGLYVLSDLAEILNINVSTFYARIVRYKWDIGKATTFPVQKKRNLKSCQIQLPT